MKKVISILICVLLLVGMAATAYAATDVDAIKPSGTTIIVGITGQDVPVHGTLPNTNAGTAIIVLAPMEYYELSVEEDGVQAHQTLEIDDPEEPSNTEFTGEDIPEDATLAEQIFILTNNERAKEDLEELEYNEKLQDAADTRAKECAERFSHTRPNGTSCHTVVADLDYKVTGENLVKADKPIATAQTLVQAWMDSEAHRDNILLKDFTSMAIGVYETDDMVYAVQIFMG
jgi:uncharacterized protein YkwD